MASWTELRNELMRVTFTRSVKEVANAILVNPRTVYRLLDGSTKRPHPSTVDRVETLVRRESGRERVSPSSRSELPRE